MRLAILSTSIPIRNATCIASIARGSSSKVLELQLTAAAARAPVHNPRQHEFSGGG